MASQSQQNALTKQRAILVLTLSLLLTGLILAFNSQRRPSNVVVLPFEESTPSHLRVVAERAEAWLRLHFFPRQKSILLSARIVELQRPVLNDFSLPAPDYSSTNGLRVWICKDGEVQRMEQLFNSLPSVKTLAKPRIQTVGGNEGAMFVGQSVPVNGLNQEVGVGLKLLPRIQSDGIDLTSKIKFTTLQSAGQLSIQTNVALRSRIHIPKGYGVLLLNADTSATNHQSIGLLISSTVQ